jgi:hypothetical protein
MHIHTVMMVSGTVSDAAERLLSNDPPEKRVHLHTISTFPPNRRNGAHIG